MGRVWPAGEVGMGSAVSGHSGVDSVSAGARCVGDFVG